MTTMNSKEPRYIHEQFYKIKNPIENIIFIFGYLIRCYLMKIVKSMYLAIFSILSKNSFAYNI